MNSNHEIELYGDPVVGRTKYEDASAPVADQGIFGGEVPTEEKVNEVLRRITEGEDAKRELSILKPALAYALSKLDKKQLRIRMTDMDTLGERFAMQAKSDGQGGIILRSVKVL